MKARVTKILPVNLLVLAVGVLDMLTTLWWIHTGSAVEFNPLMAALLRVGTPAFIAVKLSTLISYVVVLEWYSRRRCRFFARVVGVFTLFAYTSIYAACFFVVNRGCLLG